MSSHAPYLIDHIRQSWSGWKIIEGGDRFEFQEERTKGKLRFPQIEDRVLIKNLEDILLRGEGNSPVDGLLEITKKERQAGKKVEINPWALRDDHLELNIDRKKEILNRAFNEFANEQSN